MTETELQTQKQMLQMVQIKMGPQTTPLDTTVQPMDEAPQECLTLTAKPTAQHE